MRPQNERGKPNDCNYWAVSKAAGNLGNQACTLGARHIKDGTLRIQFNREVSYYARSIVNDVAQGNKTPEQGMIDIKNEQNDLLSQSREITKRGVAAIAGAFQYATGVGICYGSVGTLYLFAGAPTMADNANNRNLIESRSNTQSLVRKGYPCAAKTMGSSASEGNRTYGAMNAGLSAYSVGRMVLKPDAWRLFRYVNTDYVRAHKNIGEKALTFDYQGEPSPVLQANRAAFPPPTPAPTAIACDERFQLLNHRRLPFASLDYALLQNDQCMAVGKLDGRGHSSAHSSTNPTNLKIATSAPSPVME